MDYNSVDITFTSPPFRVEDIDHEDYWQWYSAVFKQIMRVTKEYAIIFHSATKLVELIRRYDAPYRVMVWTKLPNMMSFRYEPILIYKLTDEWKLNRTIWKDVFHYSPIVNAKKKHPYENPLKLYIDILKMIPESKLVFDPFMGSGTSALAARSAKHDFIGCEIDEKYFKIAEARCDQTNFMELIQ